MHFKPPGDDVDKRTGVATPVIADTDSPTPGHDPGKPGDRPSAWSSLASKLILFVFASTFITATIVSWISIQSTSGALREMIGLTLGVVESRVSQIHSSAVLRLRTALATLRGNNSTEEVKPRKSKR